MRVTSEFFVSALMRRVFASGGFAAIVRKGHAQAGAIFILARNRAGDVTLYGPAPQSEVSDKDDRQFEIRLLNGTSDMADALLAKEMRYDSDLYVVEIESDAIEGLIPLGG
ncbi:MAG: hypothetical protein RIR97_1796 [Pseudomonadota bacterium]|jgi:hypothetical protein